jgi:hypothetical protein
VSVLMGVRHHTQAVPLNWTSVMSPWGGTGSRSPGLCVLALLGIAVSLPDPTRCDRDNIVDSRTIPSDTHRVSLRRIVPV